MDSIQPVYLSIKHNFQMTATKKLYVSDLHWNVI